MVEGTSIETPVFSTELVSMEGTHTEGTREVTPTPAEIPLSPERATPPAVQTEIASPAAPIVLSISDPFVALSQVAQEGSSLVVTPSSIPDSAIQGPAADSSSEEFDEEESEAELAGMCLFPPS